LPVDANRISRYRKLHYVELTELDTSLGVEELVCINALHEVVETTILQDDNEGLGNELTNNDLTNLSQGNTQSTMTTRNHSQKNILEQQKVIN